MKPALFFAAAFALFLSALTFPAVAHDPGLSKGEYAIDPDEVSFTLGMSRRDLPPAIAVAKGSPLPPLDALNRELISKVRVTRASTTPLRQDCTSRVDSITPDDQDGFSLVAKFADCGTDPSVSIDLTDFFKVLPTGATHTAFIDDADGHREEVFHGGRSRFDARAQVPLDLPQTTAPKEPSKPPRILTTPFGSGFARPLFHPEHLAFLLAFLAPLALQTPGARRRHAPRLLAAYAAALILFSVLATWTVLKPNPRALAPLVIVTTLYFSLDNLFSPLNPTKLERPLVAASFGALHGFVLSRAHIEQFATPAHPFTTPDFITFTAAFLLATTLITFLWVFGTQPAFSKKPQITANVVKLLNAILVAIGLFALVRCAFSPT